jgi:serine/threonine protein kinase/class 3 adenylate cyclase
LVMNVQPALEQQAKVAGFLRKHRIGLLTLVFTDIAGSTKLKQDLGDLLAVPLIQRHHSVVRELLCQFNEAEEIETAGDSFFIVFAKPSDATRFAILLQSRLRVLAVECGQMLIDRVGIHIGEVVIEENPGQSKALYGMQVDTCARATSLAVVGQILLTRAAFDNARQVLKGQDLDNVSELAWASHGLYVLKGIDEPIELCEVGEIGKAPLRPPPDSEKAYRHLASDAEPVLGWRPAIGQAVPNTKWTLQRHLGSGGFGEVWLGRHDMLNEARVFKFCFRSDRVRALKREVTLFRLLKEHLGENPHIVAIREVFFESPPFYIVMDYAEGNNLRDWCDAQGGLGNVTLETRLELVAQAADALQAAHEAGVLHRDIKPGNILVARPAIKGILPLVKLTDFGIGQVTAKELLDKVTKAGFTHTLVGSSSSQQAGTYLYMAPELLAGQHATIRSDIYSLGVVLFQVLVGNFARPLTTDWSKAIPDSLLRDILALCFAGNPAGRFSGAGELAKSLRALPDRKSALDSRKKAIDRRGAEMAAREKAVYRRGVVRNTALTVAVIGVVAFLALFAMIQWLRANKLAESETDHRNQLEQLEFRHHQEIGRLEARHRLEIEKAVQTTSEEATKTALELATATLMSGPDRAASGWSAPEGGGVGGEMTNSIGMVLVRLPSGIWVGKYEVTQAEYMKVMKANPSNPRWIHPRQPVEQVTWNEAVEFMRRLTEMERGGLRAGQAYSLPTERQWKEFVVGQKFENLPNGTAIRKDPSLVGQSGSANKFGLFDVLGNVWEWCLDDAPGDQKLLKGGAFNSNNYDRALSPNVKSLSCGFRCILVGQ